MIPALFSIVVGVLLLGILTYWALQRDRASATDVTIFHGGYVQGFAVGIAVGGSHRKSARSARPRFRPQGIAGRNRTGCLSRNAGRWRSLGCGTPAGRWGSLMSYHAAAVRQNINLRPALEIKLGLHYVRFLVLYELILGLSHIRGPFQIRLMMGYVVGVTAQLRGVSDKLLGAAQFSTPASAPPPTQ